MEQINLIKYPLPGAFCQAIRGLLILSEIQNLEERRGVVTVLHENLVAGDGTARPNPHIIRGQQGTPQARLPRIKPSFDLAMGDRHIL
jgi:hypothetical protein